MVDTTGGMLEKKMKNSINFERIKSVLVKRKHI